MTMLLSGHRTLLKKWLSIVMLLVIPVMVYAEDVRDKRVSLSLKNVSLKQFFDTIKEQSGADFIYTQSDARHVEPITVTAQNEPLGTLLDRVFKDTGLEYTHEGNIITVRYRRPATATVMKTPVKESVPKVAIQGVVRDPAGEVLPGVNVWVTGTKIGASTDADGRYRVIVPDSGQTIVLRFTCIGMHEENITYKGDTQINLRMTSSDKMLQEAEVVATGMFVRNAETFTGAVSTFNQEQLKSMGNRNVLSSLKNIDPSFVINESVDFGSDPNKMPDIQLRGQNNLPDLEGEYKTSPNQPLFILDGFEATIEKIYDLDMNLVKSVTLLKDAAAKAIYGSKAANGVVVIETVQPEAGRLNITYTGSVDLTVADLTSYNLCNAAEKLQAELFAGKYTSDNAFTQAGLNSDYNELYKEIARGVDTYWMAQPLRVGVGHKHTLFLDGGDDAMRYSASIGYNNVAGVMKGSDRTTISGSVTLSYRYKTLSFRNQLSIDDNSAKNSPYGDFSEYSRMNPYWRINNTDGSLIKQYNISAYNPLYNAGLNSKDESSYTTITENFYAEWEAVKNLRFRARFGLTKTSNGTDVFVPASHTDYANISTTSSEYLQRGEYTQSHGKALALSADVGVAYALEVKKHLLYSNVSWTIDQSKNESTSLRVVGFPSDKMDYISFGSMFPSGSKPGGDESTTRSTGFVASFNYSFDNRYLADFSYRLSGSSQFGAKERWGHFWSAGLGWNIHKEAFMQDVKWIDLWKIRASIGYTGSQNFSSYNAIATYKYITDKTYNGDLGAVLIGLANENLKWQQQYDRNIGIDLSLFKRLSIRADYYFATTTNLLTDISLAPSAGFSTYKENMGETENKGVELSLNYRVFNHTPSRTYVNLFANIAHNTNKISKISDALKEINDAQDAVKNEYAGTEAEKALQRRPSTRFEEGQSLSAIWAVRSAGIDPVTGREVFIKKDGTTTYEWSTDDQVVCGDSQPKVNGNVGVSTSFYGFDLNLTFTYKLGGQLYNSTLVEKVENVDVYNWNVDKRVLYDRWNTPGVPAKFKSISDVSTTKPTSRFVEDYNELVLSAVSFGYDFSHLKFIARSACQYLKLSFNMNDVFWLSTVKREQGLSYPRANAFSFSLQARF
ncbi:MAG: SusC/RagA family TonB-linked outer membrane protein [Coprobacter sp.]|nr:SusC/RagA family TonB-linked outer membrane protein [Coprobacter sp.]